MPGDFTNPIQPQKEPGDESHLPRTNPELRAVNSALRTSENRFQAIVNQSHTGIAEYDVEGKFIFINKGFTGITGYTEESLYGMNMQNILHPDDIGTYQEMLRRLEEDFAVETELRCVCADGSQKWVSAHTSPIKNIYSNTTSFITAIRNIDGQKQQETRWLQDEKNLDILESITDAFFAVNNNWQITYANKKAGQLNNRAHDDLLGKVLWEEFPSLKETQYGKLYQQVAEQRLAASVIARSPADNQWYEVHAFPSKDGIVAYFKNVTEQVEAEESLRKSEENLRTLFNTIDEGFCIIEMIFDESNKPCDYRFLEYNPHFEEMTGLYGAFGKTALELVPNLEPFWIETYGNVALTGEPIRFENSSERMNRWFNVYASRVEDSHSRKVAIVFTNITQRKLIEREQERFLALGSDLQVIAGNNFKFLWVSSAWKRALGYTAEELTSVSWLEFVHPDDLPKSLDMAKANFSGGETIAWENRYRHKDGSYRWFSWNAKPYLEESVLYAVATDITERKLAEKALQESEDRYSAIIHQATAGVAEMDLQGNHLFVNKKFCEMTGFSEEELYTQKCFDYVHPDDKAQCEQLFRQTVATGKPFVSEKRIIGKDKTEIWINETISSISDAQNKTQSIVTVCIDITDRKTIEKQKDDFMGVASHELKTPVTSLKAYAQVLQMRFSKAGDQQSAAMLEKMESQINRLTILVQDLLDVTRLEGKLMQFRHEVFDFRMMVMNTIEEVQRTLPSHTIVYNSMPEAYVFADVERTSQVLVNFLTNAAKYSPKADQVIVWVSIADSHVTCSVEDFGIGIPAESQKFIFDRFYRVTDNSRNTYPGLGLGLYISAEIIKKQQGEIWFKSSVNSGSVFSFRLPLYRQS